MVQLHDEAFGTGHGPLGKPVAFPAPPAGCAATSREGANRPFKTRPAQPPRPDIDRPDPWPDPWPAADEHAAPSERRFALELAALFCAGLILGASVALLTASS